MDEDDILLEIYHRALQRDCSDPTIGGHVAAHRAFRAINCPESAAAALLAASLPHGSQRPASKILLRCGLVPFGAWAALAAASLHEPCVTPETRMMLLTLGDAALTPWEAMGSLAKLADSLRNAIRSIDLMGGILEADLVLDRLVVPSCKRPRCP